MLLSLIKATVINWRSSLSFWLNLKTQSSICVTLTGRQSQVGKVKNGKTTGEQTEFMMHKKEMEGCSPFKCLLLLLYWCDKDLQTNVVSAYVFWFVEWVWHLPASAGGRVQRYGMGMRLGFCLWSHWIQRCLVSLHREEEWTVEINYITSVRYSQQQFSSVHTDIIVSDFSVKTDSDTRSFSACYFC